MRLKKDYKYIIESYDESLDDAKIFQAEDSNLSFYLAEDAAEHYFNNRDSDVVDEWYDPLIFIIYSIDNKFIGRYRIYLNMEPSFIVEAMLRGNDDTK